MGHGWGGGMPSGANTNGRGYGKEHKRLRAAWLPIVQAGVVRCARCGYLVQPDGKWDLGHSEDRSTYTGPEHPLCNRRAGAIRGNKARGMARHRARGGMDGSYPMTTPMTTPPVTTPGEAPVHTSREW